MTSTDSTAGAPYTVTSTVAFAAREIRNMPDAARFRASDATASVEATADRPAPDTSMVFVVDDGYEWALDHQAIPIGTGCGTVAARVH